MYCVNDEEVDGDKRVSTREDLVLSMMSMMMRRLMMTRVTIREDLVLSKIGQEVFMYSVNDEVDRDQGYYQGGPGPLNDVNDDVCQ